MSIPFRMRNNIFTLSNAVPSLPCQIQLSKHHRDTPLRANPGLACLTAPIISRPQRDLQEHAVPALPCPYTHDIANPRLNPPCLPCDAFLRSAGHCLGMPRLPCITDPGRAVPGRSKPSTACLARQRLTWIHETTPSLRRSLPSLPCHSMHHIDRTELDGPFYALPALPLHARIERATTRFAIPALPRPSPPLLEKLQPSTPFRSCLAVPIRAFHQQAPTDLNPPAKPCRSFPGLDTPTPDMPASPHNATH